jgi:hypothetical protein
MFLKYFPESDLHLFQPIVQRGAHMLRPPREEALALISNTLKKVVAQNYSHLLPPTKMGNNLKLGMYDKGN